MEKIGLEVHPKMVITFVFDHPNYDQKDDLIFSRITQRFPSLFINIDKKPETTKHLKFLENPRQHTCFIIILRNNSNNTEKMQDVMEFMISPAPKPRLLAISVDEDAWDINIFKEILLYGWKEKYLDFTILGKSKGNNLTIMHYNPFTKTFYTDTYKSKTIIFPDKLNNMNGYSLKTPVWVAPSFMNYTVSNSSIKVSGDVY